MIDVYMWEVSEEGKSLLDVCGGDGGRNWKGQNDSHRGQTVPVTAGAQRETELVARSLCVCLGQLSG